MQLSFFDLGNRYDQLSKLKDPLVELNIGQKNVENRVNLPPTWVDSLFLGIFRGAL